MFEETIEDKVLMDVRYEEKYLQAIQVCEEQNMCFYKGCYENIYEYVGAEPYCEGHYGEVLELEKQGEWDYSMLVA